MTALDHRGPGCPLRILVVLWAMAVAACGSGAGATATSGGSTSSTASSSSSRSTGASSSGTSASSSSGTAGSTAAGSSSSSSGSAGFALELNADGQTVNWDSVGAETTYRIAVSDAPRTASTRNTGYFNQARAATNPQAYRPMPGPAGGVTLAAGEAVYVGVYDGSTWSANEVEVMLRVGISSSMTSSSSSSSGSTSSSSTLSNSSSSGGSSGSALASDGGLAVGMNDAVGMGRGWSDFIISNGGGPRGSGITWARRGVTGSYSAGSSNIDVDDGSADYMLAAGYSVVIILGDSACNMTLSEAQSWMTQYASYGDRIIWEYGNEPWNGTGSPLVPPGTFAQVFQSIYDWKHNAATLTMYPGLAAQPLTLPVIGINEGIPAGQNGEWWLQRYLDAVPNLQVDGFTSHPYGPANTGYNSGQAWVLEAVVAERNDALGRGFSAELPWYITEWGFSLRQGYGPYASSYADQDAKTAAGLAEAATWPWLKGIWIYSSHDDSTGYFGVFTTRCSTGAYDSDGAGEHVGGCEDNTGGEPLNERPVFETLVNFAAAHR
jgi:hypothetical protein